MLRQSTVALATALVAGAAAFAPAAHADRVGFNVSIGGPGYALSVGNGPYWGGYRPYHHRHYWRAPYVAYVAPPVVYAPVVYPAPRVVYRAPYVRYPVVRGPVYYGY